MKNHIELCKCSFCKAKRGEYSGKNNPNYGNHYSDESIEKIRQSALGHKRWLGKKHTQKSKKKMSLSKRGFVPWNKGKTGLPSSWNKGIKQWADKIPPRLGKKHSQESLLKMRVAKLGKKASEETRKKLSLMRKGKSAYWLIGKKHSAEHKLKCLLGRKKFFESKQPTSIERILYSSLDNLEIVFKKQELINDKFLVDAYVPSLNLVIEADGDYYHKLKPSIRNDIRKNKYLKKHGFRLLRISEGEIKKNDFDLSKLLGKLS